jgi:3-hydroxybutyryl-CoA dehydrogenase
MSIERVGVLGCGLMGSGIAEVMARAGYDVRVWEVGEEAREAGRLRIARSLDKAVAREKITSAERERALARLGFTIDLAELADRQLIVEAVVEDLDVKRDLFRTLDALCEPGTIFASNTSSLPITELAAAVARGDRVLGLHFFNPVPVMRLIEIVRTLETSQTTLDTVAEIARRLDKEPIWATDRAGFIVNLLLVPFILDTIRQLEHGIASTEDLDKAMVLGCGHPMGPLALCDFVGNDTVYRIAEILYTEYREPRYAPPPLLRRLVALGRFGRKSGMGFYDYSGESPVPLRL